MDEERASVGPVLGQRLCGPAASLGWRGKESWERWVSCIVFGPKLKEGIENLVFKFWQLIWIDSNGKLNLNESFFELS
jgi:hypothetical protein